MGKISGKPGPDPLAIRDEAQEEDDFLRWLGPKTLVYEITNRVKITEFDEEGHGEMMPMMPRLQELGFTVTTEKVPLDYDVEKDVGRRFRRFTYKRVSKDDVLLGLTHSPAKLPTNMQLFCSMGSNRSMKGEQLKVANSKFRMHISRLKREGKVKVRYDDDGRARYFLPEHHTDLGRTPGGQIREVPPPGALLEDNVTVAADDITPSSCWTW